MRVTTGAGGGGGTQGVEAGAWRAVRAGPLQTGAGAADCPGAALRTTHQPALPECRYHRRHAGDPPRTRPGDDRGAPPPTPPPARARAPWADLPGTRQVDQVSN